MGLQGQKHTEELKEAEAELFSEVLDVMIVPFIERYNNDVFSDLFEVGLQGQVHMRLAWTILEEAKKIAESDSTLNVMDINVLKPP